MAARRRKRNVLVDSDEERELLEAAKAAAAARMSTARVGVPGPVPLDSKQPSAENVAPRPKLAPAKAAPFSV